MSPPISIFFFNDTATTEIYTLSLHDALPIFVSEANLEKLRERGAQYVVGTPRSQLKQYEQQLLQGEWQDISKEVKVDRKSTRLNSSHSQISYAVFCLKKKKTI